MKIGYLMQAGVPDVRQRPLSGAANHVEHVIIELRQLGHQVRLLACLDGQIWKSDDLEDYEPVSASWLGQGPIHLFEGAVRRFQYELRLPYAALFESLRFAQACRQELSGHDLFYERMGWVGYGGGLAARWLGIPLVLEVNGDHLSEMELLGSAPKGAQRWLSSVLVNWGVKRASCIVATGEGWRKSFLQRWGGDPKKVIVVENGTEIAGLLAKEQLRFSNPNPNSDGGISVIYVGSLEPWHGLLKLVKAVARAITQGISLRLVLVGHGTQRKEIEELVHELRIEHHVVLTGQLPEHEVALRLAEADIGVSSYCGRVEYSGLKLLDYKAAGLAIIASGENGQPAVLEHGRTGWIVPPCDEQALYEAIVFLASHPEIRKQMGCEARIEAEQYHSWYHTAKQLEEIFLQLVQGDTNF